jgi:hypothetical protein
MALCSNKCGAPAAITPIIGTVTAGQMTYAKGIILGQIIGCKIVPESFSPLDDWKSFGYLWDFWFFFALLVLKSLPKFFITGVHCRFATVIFLPAVS